MTTFELSSEESEGFANLNLSFGTKKKKFKMETGLKKNARTLDSSPPLSSGLSPRKENCKVSPLKLRMRSEYAVNKVSSPARKYSKNVVSPIMLVRKFEVEVSNPSLKPLTPSTKFNITNGSPMKNLDQNELLSTPTKSLPKSVTKSLFKDTTRKSKLDDSKNLSELDYIEDLTPSKLIKLRSSKNASSTKNQIKMKNHSSKTEKSLRTKVGDTKKEILFYNNNSENFHQRPSKKTKEITLDSEGTTSNSEETTSDSEETTSDSEEPTMTNQKDSNKLSKKKVQNIEEINSSSEDDLTKIKTLTINSAVLKLNQTTMSFSSNEFVRLCFPKSFNIHNIKLIPKVEEESNTSFLTSQADSIQSFKPVAKKFKTNEQSTSNPREDSPLFKGLQPIKSPQKASKTNNHSTCSDEDIPLLTRLQSIKSVKLALEESNHSSCNDEDIPLLTRLQSMKSPKMPSEGNNHSSCSDEDIPLNNRNCSTEKPQINEQTNSSSIEQEIALLHDRKHSITSCKTEYKANEKSTSSENDISLKKKKCSIESPKRTSMEKEKSALRQPNQAPETNNHSTCSDEDIPLSNRVQSIKSTKKASKTNNHSTCSNEGLLSKLQLIESRMLVPRVIEQSNSSIEQEIAQHNRKYSLRSYKKELKANVKLTSMSEDDIPLQNKTNSIESIKMIPAEKEKSASMQHKGAPETINHSTSGADDVPLNNRKYSNNSPFKKAPQILIEQPTSDGEEFMMFYSQARKYSKPEGGSAKKMLGNTSIMRPGKQITNKTEVCKDDIYKYVDDDDDDDDDGISPLDDSLFLKKNRVGSMKKLRKTPVITPVKQIKKKNQADDDDDDDGVLPLDLPISPKKNLVGSARNKPLMSPVKQIKINEEYEDDGVSPLDLITSPKNDQIVDTPSRSLRDRSQLKRVVYNIQELSSFITPTKVLRNSAMNSPRSPSLRQRVLEANTPKGSRSEQIVPKTPTSVGRSPAAKKKLDLTPSTPHSLKKVGHGFLTPVAAQREKQLSHTPCSGLDKVRAQLQVSTLPTSLPCREREYNNIKSFLLRKLEDRTGGCMYISGVPGTGKTATVHTVVKFLQQSAIDGDLVTFDFVELNGLRLTEPRQAYVRIWQTLTGTKQTPEQALKSLIQRFTKKTKKSTILLVDELDYLCNKRQDVIYNILDWSTQRDSKLIVLTIANTMDLPERTLKGKVTSRMGLTRLVFQPYTFQQLQEIVLNRLNGCKHFHADAVQLVARKVAAVSGDARRALDICRRSTELIESDSEEVKVLHIQKALNQIFTGVRVQAIKNSSIIGQLVLRSLRDEVLRTGVEESTVGYLYPQLDAICAMEGCPTPSIGEVLSLCSNLADSGLILAEKGRRDLNRKLSLNVSPDDIHYALSC